MMEMEETQMEGERVEGSYSIEGRADKKMAG